METKPLLYGLIGFFIGGLLVSVAATVTPAPAGSKGHASMADMVQALENKRGDEFDKAFIEQMIEHHEGAIDMARLSASRAKHDEIKDLSADVIRAQQSEIDTMRQWQRDWSYADSDSEHGGH